MSVAALRLTISVLVGLLLLPEPASGAESGAAAKGPSVHTRARAEALRAALPFEDVRDFEEHRRGFIAAPAERVITGEDGREVWNIGAYDFLLDGRPLDTVHPSLQRQATLNMNYGLYEVVPGHIYQVRGFDLSNMTLVRGDTGWILFDVLLTRETARAALAFANAELGARPVIAVVYSHSHADHFGGVRGVVDEAQVAAGDVAIIAPDGFMEHAVSENVYAGNAMTRRAAYQYGRVLPVGPAGQVDSAIGKATSSGRVGLIAPTDHIRADFEERTIDGVRMIFQNTPGTEAPAEMNTYFPQWKAFWAAENVSATVHNVYTLRGALVRDALQWSKHINEALYRFGHEAEVMLASHNWPRWGNDRVREVLRAQRDAYANLNNQVLHLANQGVTINEIHNVYRVPDSLARQWSVRHYHGSEFHNARAVINRYLGYWDGNPATLMPLSPADTAPLYVEMMGGAGKILERSRTLYDQGEYRLAMEIVNKLVYAEPDNRPAAYLLADLFEQLGYQAESTSVRNVHLAAARELRDGIAKGATADTSGGDLARSLTTAQWWDAVAIRVDSSRADGMAFVMNFATPDNGERFVVEMSGGTLTIIQGYQADDADVEVHIDRAELEPAIAGEATLGALLQQGRGTVRGDAGVLAQLASTLVQFDPDFEIMPGTRGRLPETSGHRGAR
jgi:alkyl sulfatase BDS1-like metallo-beta-lactamase superfamily hydrolase